MLPTAPVLFAAGLDWLEGLLPVVFVLIWIVSQVMNLFRNAAGKPADRPAAKPARAPRAAARPPRPAAEPPAGDIDREIQEFLAQALRGQKPQPVPQRPVTRPRSGKPSEAKSAGLAGAKGSGSRRDAAGERRIGGLAGREGDVADHVAAAFAHDLAHEVPVAAAAAGSGRPSGMVDDLVAAVRSPDELRKLILLREVLDRPTHRW